MWTSIQLFFENIDMSKTGSTNHMILGRGYQLDWQEAEQKEGLENLCSASHTKIIHFTFKHTSYVSKVCIKDLKWWSNMARETITYNMLFISLQLQNHTTEKLSPVCEVDISVIYHVWPTFNKSLITTDSRQGQRVDKESLSSRETTDMLTMLIPT